MTSLQRLLPGRDSVPLFDSAESREIERAALASTAPNALMEAAGMAVARLALALAPHAERIWIAAGPGNNGGDGLVAARHLHRWGKQVHVTWQGDPARLPADAAQAREAALAVGLTLHPPSSLPGQTAPLPQLCMDALLGLGQQRAAEGEMATTIAALNRLRRGGATLLAVDLPTGLSADTGRRLGDAVVEADATLALLTPKPGLFTAEGRDAAGQVWWDSLGIDLSNRVPTARLSGGEDARSAHAPRLEAGHASHKGRFGDTWVVGGAPGMSGAVHLAASASLRAGAGRVYLTPLSDPAPSPAAPEIMQRPWAAAHAAHLADQATVVCGCGGGEPVRHVLPELLARARRLVLDADALNAIATDTALATLLEARGRRGEPTILTPHPLEAARLLDSTAAKVQSDRLAAARTLSERFAAVVLLKGSGSVITTPGRPTVVNSTGNARLATAGTGDVLAGWIGGCWSGHVGYELDTAGLVAVGSAWLHGWAVHDLDAGLPLPAGQLVDAMARAADKLGR
ncbi:NAD(P)H-hydrate dehydratase [Ideonella sp. YS5]|uniref:NAD(P)H-hydrate dehydratase n=1 Tax=Ideonella sp. YS5 TaxID=3453714 RepID=UPI003EEDBCFE